MSAPDGLEPGTPEPHVQPVSGRPLRRLLATLIDDGLLLLILWFVLPAVVVVPCWLFTLAWGQTPGKFATGLVAVRSDGTPFGWGRMFVRELFLRIFWTFTLGVGMVVDAGVLMLSHDRRSVTDRVVGSTIARVAAQHN